MSLVSIFASIRDRPYAIPLAHNDPDNDCAGKVVSLRKALVSSGYEARYRVCDFVRSDLNLPSELLAVDHADEATHVYLEVCIDNEYIVLDPTRDRQLDTVLPVNYRDGRSNTYFAVKPLRLYSLLDSQKIMEQEDLAAVEQDLANNKAFYIQLNKRLASVRVSRGSSETV